MMHWYTNILNREHMMYDAISSETTNNTSQSEWSVFDFFLILFILKNRSQNEFSGVCFYYYTLGYNNQNGILMPIASIWKFDYADSKQTNGFDVTLDDPKWLFEEDIGLCKLIAMEIEIFELF